MGLNPKFDFTPLSIGVDAIKADAQKMAQTFEPIPHTAILKRLLEQLEQADFRELAGLKDETDKLQNKHLYILGVEQILEAAQRKDWGLCRHLSFVYLYNSAYWRLFDCNELKTFLGEATEKLGVGKFDARYFRFRENLLKSFFELANLPKPEPLENVVLVNLKNGTFEISPTIQRLRPPNRADFLTYQLPFEYNPNAKAPMFHAYLNTVQPDMDCQKVLAEYLAYVFIKSNTLKLEKTLLLYGTGANGKSVFFEIVSALLGKDNVCHNSLGNLTDESGYYRAKLAGKLVNYSSEINGIKNEDIFKQLVSGESVTARLPYQDPFEMTDYAKLIFNCNELPLPKEHTHAFFRRFIIVPFKVTIPENEQDKELHKKIIKSELSGVFNWVLEGLTRLLAQKNFTDCAAIRGEIDQYKKQSDSVQMFLEEESYVKAVNEFTPMKDVYYYYKMYCTDNAFRVCSSKTFGERLRNIGYQTEKKNIGQVVYLKQQA